mgnify:CR=1 FL=1
MIEKGDLYQSGVEFNGELILVQVQRTYDKADIDPECPESVAIIGMVEAVVPVSYTHLTLPTKRIV